MIHADRQKDRHDEANSRFSLIFASTPNNFTTFSLYLHDLFPKIFRLCNQNLSYSFPQEIAYACNIYSTSNDKYKFSFEMTFIY